MLYKSSYSLCNGSFNNIFEIMILIDYKCNVMNDYVIDIALQNDHLFVVLVVLFKLYYFISLCSSNEMQLIEWEILCTENLLYHKNMR